MHPHAFDRRRRLARLLATACLLAAACVDTRPPLEVPPLQYGLGEHWLEDPVLPQVRDGWVVVTNSLDDTVTLFELAEVTAGRLRPVAHLPVGLTPVTLEGPHHAAASPSGERVYVGISNFVPGAGSGPHGAHGLGNADGYLLELDGTTGRQLRSVRVDRSPGDLAVTADGRTALVTHFDLLRLKEVDDFADPAGWSRMVIIDLETMERRGPPLPLCPAAHGLKISADAKRAYAACFSDEVAVVDLETNQVKRIPVASDAAARSPPIHEPYALALSPSGAELWVSSIRSGRLQILNTASLEIERSLALFAPPYFGAFSSNGASLYVPRQNDDRLLEVDTASGTIRREIPLRSPACTNLHQVELVSDAQALVVCEGNRQGPGALVLVDLLTGSLRAVAPVGIFPDSVVVARRRAQ